MFDHYILISFRYSRFLKNKDVKGYSEEDKNIIFGNVNEGDLTPMSGILMMIR